MRVDPGAAYAVRVEQALGDEHLRTALTRATGRLAAARAEAMSAVDGARLRREAGAVRRDAIRRLPELLETLERNLSANGVQVHWARDGREATAIVRDIARRRGARRVVKSKSMVTEEIHLNEALEADGLRVVETDLGEYIIQLAGEPPSHIIAPVIHRRLEDVSELFREKLGTPATDDPATLCAAARAALRDEFLTAEVGVSGCNFAVAETGTVCIITNEGNGRMVTSMPPVYVAVAGIEKVVPTVEDAVLLWQAAARSATGQGVSVYFSMSSGPRSAEHPDGPDEMHVVLLDNGRSRVLERGYADALLCIRCGACLNACPVYREIGGHAYGRTPYSGPIGAVVSPLLGDDITEARDLPFASSLCGACKDVCPVEIDLPRLLLDLRADLVRGGAAPAMERAAMRLYATAAARPAAFRGLAAAGRRLLRAVFRNRGDGSYRLPGPLSRWTRTRTFPGLAPKTFRDLWRRRGGDGGAEDR